MDRGAALSHTGDADALVEAISQHDLPDAVHPLLESYEATLGDRDRFFWRWLDSLFPAFTLSCTAPDAIETVQTAKLLASIYVTVLDDVAEKHDDRDTFEEAAKIPFDPEAADPDRSDVSGDVIAFLQELWRQFEETSDGPRHDEFQELLMFDIKQVINAIEYSYILNHHLHAVTENELWTHDVHNMAVFVYADVDLMFSPAFDRTELAQLRQVVRHGERIARVCNWVTTWERELHEGDCSSGVIIHALNAGIVSLETLEVLRENPSEEHVTPVIETIHDHAVEAYFRERLQEEYAAAEEWGQTIDSVDIEVYLDGFDIVQEYHRASKAFL